jgi:hypothetical protein
MVGERAVDVRRRGLRAYWLGFVLVAVAVLVGWWTVRVFGGFGAPLAWRFTARWAALWAAAIVVLALVCTHWAIRLSPGTPERPGTAELAALSPADRVRRIRDFRRSGLKGLVVGVDGRASTSQVAVVIWTVALAFGLLMLLFAGRTPNCPEAGAHFGSCPADPMGGAGFADALGRDFRWEYLLLLGWPVALAVAARQQVVGALRKIDEVKPPVAGADGIGVLAGLRDVVSDDRGRGALLDAQYFAFTLITVGYFGLELVAHPARGLPAFPPALLVIMAISGAGYLSGKVLDPIGERDDRPAEPPEPAARALPAVTDDTLRDDKTTVINDALRDDKTTVINMPPRRDEPTIQINR